MKTKKPMGKPASTLKSKTTNGKVEAPKSKSQERRLATQQERPLPKKTTALKAAPKKTEADDGWQKIETVKKYFRYKECKKGQVLIKEGLYIGDSPNQFGRDNHDFKEKDGTVVSLNASGQLDYILQNNVKIGDTVKVVYQGTSTLEKGRYKNKEAHNFEVFVKPGKQAQAAEEVEDDEEELDEMDVGALKSRASEEDEESEEEEEIADDEETYEDSDEEMSLEELEG